MRSIAFFAPLALASGLLFPFATYAALVNINTADSATLEDLPGVGPSTAASIIANRPYASIEDISRTDGIGAPGSSSYEKIKDLIAVGDASAPSTSSTGGSTTTATTAVPSGGSGGSASTYVPPPSAITVDIDGARTASLNVPVTFSAVVRAKGGAADPSAEIVWSFGDGSSASGRIVEKTYRHEGTYLVVARGRDGTAIAEAQMTVLAHASTVRIKSITSDGVVIDNGGEETLELSGWRLSTGLATFRFSDGTMLLPKSSVLFPWLITNLPIALEALLSYPDGVIAARYPEPVASTPVQPEAAPEGSQGVQTVESVLSNTSPPAHAPEALDAPRTKATSPVSRGAAMGEVPVAASTTPAAAASAPGIAGIFHSGWIIGVLGIIALAGGIFMIL
ncbi:MAG: helix-hairpin-helix domain-containing protein [bacterium]|nr:helix-hairpin-helix domain-containing protein [bacterium]